MIKWYSFEKKRPKRGWYLVYMEATLPTSDSDDGILSINVGDLVCVAFYDPKSPDGYQWHSAIFDNIKIAYWSKINIPSELDVFK